MTELFIFSLALAASYYGVEIFRRWSLKKQIVDVPNERSSHAAPTPRGGGLFFVAISLVFYAAAGFSENSNFQWSYLCGAVLIAGISWLDDLFSVKTMTRFLVHGLAAFLIIFANGYWHKIDMPFYGSMNFGAAGAILTFCWIVGLTNAYNFMDGIDGIAATQALTAGLGWLVVGTVLGSEQTALYAGVLAFACLGFLIHNRQPARIFMGDVGSTFLGYTFAVLPILAKTENASNAATDAVFPLIGVLLVWFFVFDAFYTFVRRLLKKRKVWQAHREHLYQKMVVKGFSHRAVTAIYGALSCVLLCFSAGTAIFGKKYLVYAFPAAIIQSLMLVLLARPVKNRDV